MTPFPLSSADARLTCGRLPLASLATRLRVDPRPSLRADALDVNVGVAALTALTVACVVIVLLACLPAGAPRVANDALRDAVDICLEATIVATPEAIPVPIDIQPRMALAFWLRVAIVAIEPIAAMVDNTSIVTAVVAATMPGVAAATAMAADAAPATPAPATAAVATAVEAAARGAARAPALMTVPTTDMATIIPAMSQSVHALPLGSIRFTGSPLQ
ncbi:hypothetical protein [Luteibacter sp. RCC_6_2]|uniref:hypothetical protein n=1 Tax=Luteibacter sp. RCC_6_2 TaxID=3239223 RepID=UPI003524B7E4